MYTEEIYAFFENLRTYRKKNKLSKTEMAKRLHISVRTLNLLEDAHLPPRLSADILFYFARLCNMPVSAVFKPFYV